MTARLSSRLANLRESDLAGLADDDVFALTRLVQEKVYDAKDALCSRAFVDDRGYASETCGPLYWGQNLTKTLDDHALAKGTPARAPFPRKTYFRPLMGKLLQPVIRPSTDCHVTFFPKSREMLTSWSICLFIAWVCQWRPGTLAVIQTLKETKAEELVRYTTILAENQEPWLRERHPLARSVALELEWENGSRVFGIPGGENQIRMFHPMIVVFDEMAFMEDAEACFNAVRPVAKQIIGVSSAHASWFGDQCSL